MCSVRNLPQTCVVVEQAEPDVISVSSKADDGCMDVLRGYGKHMIFHSTAYMRSSLLSGRFQRYISDPSP